MVSGWPMSVQSGQPVGNGLWARGLCFFSRLRVDLRLFSLLFRFLRFPQRMESRVADLLSKRECVPSQQINMIIAERREGFHVLWHDGHIPLRKSATHFFHHSCVVVCVQLFPGRRTALDGVAYSSRDKTSSRCPVALEDAEITVIRMFASIWIAEVAMVSSASG